MTRLAKRGGIPAAGSNTAAFGSTFFDDSLDGVGVQFESRSPIAKGGLQRQGMVWKRNLVRSGLVGSILSLERRFDRNMVSLLSRRTMV
jgi:hypothetical protein